MTITTPGAKASMTLKQELVKLNNYLLNFQKCARETRNDATKLLICKEIADTFLHMNVQKALKKMMKTNKTETQNLIRNLLVHNVNAQVMVEKPGFLQHYRHINEYFNVLKIFQTQVQDIHVVYGISWRIRGIQSTNKTRTHPSRPLSQKDKIKSKKQKIHKKTKSSNHFLKNKYTKI